jgi:hypothetical protein
MTLEEDMTKKSAAHVSTLVTHPPLQTCRHRPSGHETVQDKPRKEEASCWLQDPLARGRVWELGVCLHVPRRGDALQSPT